MTRPRRTVDGAGAGGAGAVDVFTTKAGAVRGRRAARDRGIVVVRGLPYAAPPFGDLRFRAPRPAEPWDGVRDCPAFGPVAPQSAELPGAPVWSPGDEDILTLNIWTPADGPGDLPVLVWIHGGAYVFGSSAQPDFDGTALAGRGLVVVTLNSRIGFEGFGHVPAAEDRDGPTPAEGRGGPAPDADGSSAPFPDNRGLLDQIAALEWVRDNISAFGGSPDRVTLAGQSSGATSVACLTVADRARGLFRRAVLHSAVNAFATVEQAARTTAEVAAEAGAPATRAGLLATPPEALVAAVRLAAAGESPSLLKNLAADIAISGDLQPDSPARFPALTEREHATLQLICEGMDYQSIAARQHVAETTVKTHARSLRDKLGAQSLAQLVVRAVQYRLYSPS